ncbi:MAG: tRNA-dihydrouridine synthase family protein [Acetatifactor sp.]|nr:tRNA-dihydrouridine synthase family protein [Acetatifactor sp.]
MKYYLAPMEGITTYNFRRAYHKYYGGVDKYFTPFITGRNLGRRQRDDILPEHNEGMHTVPQILTNRADEFLSIAQIVASYGYGSVNLNLGCPSGTVTAKKRGAGFLSVPEDLERFLDEIFDKCSLKISIKTRVGVENLEEWDRLLELYAGYPVEELIIHPRLMREGYGGQVHLEAFEKAVGQLKMPLCYNGDVVSLENHDDGYGTLGWLSARIPEVNTVMIGRGILQRPGLLTGEDSLSVLRAFHDEVLAGYVKIMSGDTNTLYKMKDLWTFMGPGFKNSERLLKKIRKASNLSEYEAAVDAIFNCECYFNSVGGRWPG